MNNKRKPHIFTPDHFVSRAFPVCFVAIAFLWGTSIVWAQTPAPSSNPTASAEEQTQINSTATELAQPEPAATLSADELASLVGPIALYPDPLLFQVLAASTYPLEIVQLKQWLGKNQNLKGTELAEAVSKQNWDPSVQALAPFPILVDKLANDIQWTTDLGNAFLAQQSDVMDAVQSLRAVAQRNGALKTNDKQKVGTESTDDGKQAITIESAQREVVYVPTYNTEYVYRNSGYSDDSSYSSGYSGYSGSSGYSDDGYSYVGYAIGAAYGAAYGYYNWRDRYGYTNGDNYYVKNYNNSGNSYRNIGNNNGNNSYRDIGNGNGSSSFRNNGNYNSANSFRNNANNAGLNQGSGRWQHDPSHRGGAPYGNSNLAKQFGQANNRLSTSSLANRASQLRNANGGNQPARANNLSRLGTRAPNPGAANRIGNRAPANFPGNGRGGAFSAPRGDVARAFSARGAQSMGPPAGFRGGPPSGLRAGGPPMGGGFHGGPPVGGGGPPMGGGLPPGGAPPPPPPPPP